MSSLSFIRTINELQIGITANKKKIYCKNTRIASKICSFFLNQGLFHYYKRTENNKYEVFLKSRRNQYVIKKLHLISKPALKKFYSLYKIKTLLWKNQNHIYLISASTPTVTGFINQYEAAAKQTGGEILLNIETI